jgi:hypothetical protein
VPDRTLTKEELEKRKEELPSCVKIGTRDGAPFVEFHVTPHSRSGFPIGQLCHYTLESNADGGGDEPPERLTLAFPTADVVIVGARLGKLVEAVNDRALAAVIPLDARHAGTLGKQPWVAKVIISRIDKSGCAPG